MTPSIGEWLNHVVLTVEFAGVGLQSIMVKIDLSVYNKAHNFSKATVLCPVCSRVRKTFRLNSLHRRRFEVLRPHFA